MARYIEETDVYKLVEPRGVAKVHCSQIDELPRADVVPKSEVEALVSAVDNSTKEFLKLHDAYQKQKAEIERLNKVMDIMVIEHNNLMATAKAEAIKEFAERVKIKCEKVPQYHFSYLEVKFIIDQIAKELTGENT